MLFNNYERKLANYLQRRMSKAEAEDEIRYIRIDLYGDEHTQITPMECINCDAPDIIWAYKNSEWAVFRHPHISIINSDICDRHIIFESSDDCTNFINFCVQCNVPHTKINETKVCFEANGSNFKAVLECMANSDISCAYSEDDKEYTNLWTGKGEN